MDIAETLTHVARLPERARDALIIRLQYQERVRTAHTGIDRLLALKFRERLFVVEYCVNCDIDAAAQACGIKRSKAKRWLTIPTIEAAIQQRLERASHMAELDAKYVREYIKGILEMLPMDLFTPGEGGGWMISKDNYDRLTQEQKRYIEEPTLVFKGGQCFLTVKFISKTAALALACRYTLPSKVEVTVTNETDKFFKDLAGLEREAQDHVETRLAEYKPHEVHANGKAPSS